MDGESHDVESLSREELSELRSVRRGRAKVASSPAFNTPSLNHLALTAPYMHDGSAPSLEVLLAQNRDRMGRTSQLTGDERAALVAYLKTL